jgi:hypothetical protein
MTLATERMDFLRSPPRQWGWHNKMMKMR